MMPMGTPDAGTPGPPAAAPVFIHGSGGDHRVWGHQTACFAGGAYVDLPGHPAGTAVGDGPELAEAMAGALGDSERPVVLVGHSLGGALALEVALAQPELVEGVVVVASGARLPVPDRAFAGLEADFDGECARLLAGFLADPGAATVPVAEALVECGPETLAADYAACRSIDLRGRLDDLAVPVLVVAGSDDPLAPPWLARELAEELPLPTMVVVEGVRHMPMVEAPATVNLLIGAYLARLGLEV